MSKAAVDIETNIDDAMKSVHEMTGKVPEAADDAVKILAHRFIREAGLTMQRNDSVVTGQGIRSLHTRNPKEGVSQVWGAQYLKALDTGTPPHWPDADSYRFRAAARSYGVDRVALARTIARQGTKPHPWIRETSDIVNQSAGQRLKIQVDKAISESLRT